MPIWGIIVVAFWIVRSDPADKAYRATVRKVFAACLMLVAVVSLSASLGSMYLTHQHQQVYYGLVIDEQRNEIPVQLGKDWADNFRGLPAEIFLVGEAVNSDF